jgi:hypothetical protein
MPRMLGTEAMNGKVFSEEDIVLAVDLFNKGDYILFELQENKTLLKLLADKGASKACFTLAKKNGFIIEMIQDEVTTGGPFIYLRKR